MRYRAYLYEGDRLIAATWHEGGKKIDKVRGDDAELPIVFEIPVECEPTHVVVFDDIVVYPKHRVRLMPNDVYRIDEFHEPEPKRRVVEIIHRDGRREYPVDKYI